MRINPGRPLPHVKLNTIADVVGLFESGVVTLEEARTLVGFDPDGSFDAGEVPIVDAYNLAALASSGIIEADEARALAGFAPAVPAAQ